MPTFNQLEREFVCPYRHGCPYLEGLSTEWVWDCYQETAGLRCDYEHIIEEQDQALAQAQGTIRKLEQENQQLRAQLTAQHRRQFKGRRKPPTTSAAGCSPGKRKKRGAPVGHPPWQRPQPDHIDRVIPVPAPRRCPRCHSPDLLPVKAIQEHLQEDIVLQPRSEVTAYRHQQAYCPCCERNVWQCGPGELPGAYIGPAAKATEIFLRQELNIPYRKISRLFTEFFGLSFVPASAFGFERQAVRRGQPLYADLRQKIRALAVAHLDDTSWRDDGQPGFVWYVGDDDVACFVLDAHRTAEVAQSLLGKKFGGVLVADALASYKAVHPKDWQSCLAHIKNKAKELGQELALLKGKAADPQARQFCQDVQGWVHDTCQAHHRLCQGPWRAQAARRIGQARRRQLRKLCRTPLRYAKAEKFRRRLSGPEQKHLLTCFKRPKVPPTNNQAERSLRPIVIMRKVIQGTRSDKGLENHSVLRSLFETARRQGRKAHEFFLDLFTKDTAQAQAALYRKTAKGERKTPKGKARPP
jgi:transposase